MYDLFNMLLDSVCQDFVRNFCIYAHQLCWPVVFLFCGIFGFGIRVMVASQNEFGSLPSSGIFWKSLSRIGVSSSLNFWQNSTVKPSGVCWKISDYSFNFRACDGSGKIFYFSLVQFWKVLLSKNWSISSTLSILLAYNC